MSETPLYVVDAFTSKAFTGNPAGVCILDAPRPESWMQAVAAEMRHAETAFVQPRGGSFDLRWFTPTTEVDLCGHATLATARVLYETGLVEADHPILFRTKSGELTAWQEGDAIMLDFPAEVVSPMEDAAAKLLAGAIGVEVLEAGRNRMDALAVVESEAVLRSLSPSMELIAVQAPRGVIVTAPGTQHDFVSRFFAPQAGVDEDPVTGSAHCALAPFWAEKYGKSRLRAAQLSARGGELTVEVLGNRVRLMGESVMILRGVLVAQP